MAMDLTAVAVIGAILEALATKVGGQMLFATPTLTIAFLIVFLSVTRWNLWGLVIIPIMVLANFVGGKLISVDILTEVYSWRLELSSAIGLASMGLNVILFKKFTTKNCMDSIVKVVGFLIVDYILYIGIQLFFYNLFTTGNPFTTGAIIADYVDSKTKETITYNLCLFVRSLYVYNLLGLGIAIIGSILLRSQGALNNAKSKLIEDKKQVELNIIDQEFRIQEENEEDSNCDTLDDTNNVSKN